MILLNNDDKKFHRKKYEKVLFILILMTENVKKMEAVCTLSE